MQLRETGNSPVSHGSRAFFVDCVGLRSCAIPGRGDSGPVRNGMIRRLLFYVLALVAAEACHAVEPPASRLVVGGDTAYPPFEWTEEDELARGFNVELIRLLTEPEGVETEFRLGDWPDVLAGLDAGAIDIVPMFVSEQRRQRYRFTNIYVFQTHVLFGLPVREPLDGISALGDSTLVVESRSYAEDELRDLQPEMSPKLTENTRQALRMVAEGNVDYALLAAPVAQELIARAQWSIERKSPPMWPRGYAFAVRMDNEALADWLQSRLVEVMSNGQYLELYDQWSDRLEPGREPVAGYFRMALMALALVALAIVAFLIWNFSLRRQVSRRTRQVVDELDQRQKAESRAREMARREPITGLYNARYFCGKCDEKLEAQPAGQKAELMLVRLLEVETVVRAFGYRVAEKMITGFGAALRRTFDEPVAHLGRGTFAVFGQNGAASERIDQLERSISQDESLIHPRFVTGSAIHPDDDTDVNELLHKAELALAESLSQQCRWTRYRNDLQADPADLEIIQSVHGDEIDGLTFAVQPQISLRDGAIQAGELLARWRHPALGDLQPDHFIPLLESAGLIGRLTRHAFDEAFALLSQLEGCGDYFEASVNVSARDLADPLFYQRLAESLEKNPHAAGKLKLEITETGLIDDRSVVRDNLERLANRGLKISIDDFGTGYSTLDYISRFPISEVKIDRCFVSRMLESARDMSIVRSTIAMAHEMDMMVLGEGAETRAHIDTLADLGCDLAQGWAVGYPQSRDEFLERLRSGESTWSRA